MSQLRTEIEILSSLAQDEDQSNHVLCTIIGSYAEGQDWALHAQSKQIIEDDFPKFVESLSEFLYKNEAHCLSKKINFAVSSQSCIGKNQIRYRPRR